MKKLSVICLALVMVLTMSLSVFAAPGAFVQSPTLNTNVELVSFETGEDCTAIGIVTPYSERHTLHDEKRQALEEAYKQIVEYKEGNGFYEALCKLAEEKGMQVSELSVADLFDISYYDCPDHDGHDGFTITIKSEYLDKFVGILHMDPEEGWEIIEIKGLDKDAKTVTFFVKTLSPFAIVVDNGTGDDAAQTGDGIMIYAGVMLAAACGLTVVLLGSKKKRA